MAQSHRIAGVALMQVGHLAGEHLDVGAADAGPLDVDHHLARLGDRCGNRRDVRLLRAGNDERPHRRDARTVMTHAGRGPALVMVRILATGFN